MTTSALPSCVFPPRNPPSLPTRPVLRVDVDSARGAARLWATWERHPPRHVMRFWQHQMAALVWARSGDHGWEVDACAGAAPGNLPRVGVEVTTDGGYLQLRQAEVVLVEVARAMEAS